MKRFFVLFSLVFVIFLCNTFSINASESDATIRGYNISKEWTYVNDAEYEFEDVYGDHYYEGQMFSWMGIYKHFDNSANEMFVLVLCTGKMQPNQKSYWDQRRWNNQEMKIEFYPEIENTFSVSEVSCGPQSSESTTSWGTTVIVGNSNLGIEFQNTNTEPDISVSAKIDDQRKNKVIITHSFNNYSRNTDIKNICCSLVEKNNFATFKIKNYNSNDTYKFYIDFTATFFRYGVYNSSSVSQRQTTIFTI